MDIRRIKPLFDELSALPKSEQARHLAQLSIGETTRKALARLLQLDEVLATTPDSELFSANPDPSLPEQIGPYRVERLIGSGGMGRVYAANRLIDGVPQRVAIKVIRQEHPNEAGIARFHTERQVLALLKHPNIASLFDWGDDESGRPYLVMELADGLPIDQHANQHSISLPDRIRLVRVAATAIAHAHKNLIIHRDLKPGNVIVDGHGTVKVIDFGIAKPLMQSLGDIPVEATGTDQRFFSPRSAAPEQLRGGLATPASDVYGLGVLLYELITDRPVFDLRGRTASEVERMILEQDPVAPSRIARSRSGSRLDADLDAIILCCLRKEPKDRYASVDHLIEDLDAWAEQRPVAARRGGFTYRSRRFVTRHRRLMIAGLAAALILATSSVLIMRANQTTEVEVARSDKYADLLLNELDRPHGIGAGPQEDEIIAALELVAASQQEDDESSEQKNGSLELDIAEALFRTGNLDAALEVAGKAATEGTALGVNDRRKAALVASINFARGDVDRAVTALTDVVSTSMDPDFFEHRFLYWRSRLHSPNQAELREYVVGAGTNKLGETTKRAHLFLLGDIDAAMGNDEMARESYLAILDRTDPAIPADVLTRLEAHRRMVALGLRLRDTAIADEHYAAAEALSVRLSGENAEPGLAMRAVFHGLANLEPHINKAYIEYARDMMRYRGMSAEVLAECERMLRLGLAFDPDHGNTHVLLGYVLTHAGRGTEAGQALDRAVELAADSPWLHVNRGELRRLSGDLPGAEASLTLAMKRTDLPEDVEGAALMMLGTVQAELGRGDAARESFEAAIRIRPDAAVIGNYARTLRVNLLDTTNAEVHAREAVELTGGATWQTENLGATLWLKWAEMQQSGANKARTSAVRAEAEQWMPNPASLVFEFHRYPRVHPIMAAVKNLGVPLDENPDAGPGATTIMELAVNAGNVPIVKGLIDLGVDPNLRGFEAFPPLGLAIQRGRAEMVDLLLDHGANPHMRSNNGESMRDLALRIKDLDPGILARLKVAEETIDATLHLKESSFPSIGYVYRFVKAPDPLGGSTNGFFKPGEKWRFQGQRRSHAQTATTSDQKSAPVTDFVFSNPDGTRQMRWTLPAAERSSWMEFITLDDPSA